MKFYQTKDDLRAEREIIASIGARSTVYKWLSRTDRDSPVDVAQKLIDGRRYATEVKDRYSYDVPFLRKGGCIISQHKIDRGLAFASRHDATAVLVFRSKEKRIFGVRHDVVLDVAELSMFQRTRGADHREDRREMVYRIPLDAFKELEVRFDPVLFAQFMEEMA